MSPTEGDDVKTPRRHRFLWTRDYDELARDASVIIKARCRGPTRLDWGAMEQIFPAVPRNSVRQRLVHLRDVPGTETYLARLEDKWYDLWVQHRGTDELPDPDPASATNFNLAAHVKFLRKHIDKNAMCVSSHLLRCFYEMISVWGGMHAYVTDHTFSQTRWLRRDTRQSNGGPAGLH